MTGGPTAVGMYHQALAAGVSRGLLAASGIALGALLIAVITIRGHREDLGVPEATNLPGRREPFRDEPVRIEPGRDEATREPSPLISS